MRTGRRDRHGTLGHLLTADVGKIFFIVRQLLNSSSSREGVGSMSSSPVRNATVCGKAVDRDHIELFERQPPSPAFALGTMMPFEVLNFSLLVPRPRCLPPAAIAMESAPFTAACYHRAPSSPTIAY